MADNNLQAQADNFAAQLASRAHNAYLEFVSSSTQLDNLQDSFEALAMSSNASPAIKQWAAAVLGDMKMVNKALSKELLSKLYSDLNNKPKTAAVIDALLVLADELDNLGFAKEADLLDGMIVEAKRDNQEDWSELSSLFDKPLDMSDTEEKSQVSGPGMLESLELPEPTDEDPEKPGQEEWKMVGSETPLDELRNDPSRIKKWYGPHGFAETTDSFMQGRKEELQRRNKLMQLKKLLDRVDEKTKEELEEELEDTSLEKAPDLMAVEDEKHKAREDASFEDEGDDEFDADMNNADDADEDLGILKELFDKMPDLAKKVLTLIKEHPELVEVAMAL